jgi:hypothetical protein
VSSRIVQSVTIAVMFNFISVFLNYNKVGFSPLLLRSIFEPKWDEVTGDWRTMHNEELHGLYSSPSIVRVIKARRMRWAGHVARMGGCIQHFGWEA